MRHWEIFPAPEKRSLENVPRARGEFFGTGRERERKREKVHPKESGTISAISSRGEGYRDSAEFNEIHYDVIRFRARLSISVHSVYATRLKSETTRAFESRRRFDARDIEAR